MHRFSVAAALVVWLAHGGASASEVLVLIDAGAKTTAIADASFVHALSVQLDLYGIRVKQQSWRPPAKADQQLRAARQQLAPQALAVIWYRFRGRRVHLNLAEPQGPLKRITLTRDPAIERTMAVAVRSLLRASLARYKKQQESHQPTSRPAPTSAPTSQPAPASAPASRPTTPPEPWVTLGLGAGYQLAPILADVEFRHGPVLRSRLYLGRRWSVGLDLLYLATLSGQTASADWKRHLFGIRAEIGIRWLRGDGWELANGLNCQLRGSLVQAEQPAGSESALAWELALGVTGSFRHALGSKLHLVLDSGIGYLPVSHQILVANERVGRPGRLELLLLLGLEVTLIL